MRTHSHTSLAHTEMHGSCACEGIPGSAAYRELDDLGCAVCQHHGQITVVHFGLHRVELQGAHPTRSVLCARVHVHFGCAHACCVCMYVCACMCVYVCVACLRACVYE